MQLGVLCEEIKRILDGQNDAPDSKFTMAEIAVHVNQGLAVAIKENLYENSQIDGLTYVDDQFIFDYRNIAIVSGSAMIPEAVVGLPRMRGFVSVSNSNGTGSEFIPVQAKDVFLQTGTKPIKNKTLYYIKGAIMYFIGGTDVFVDMSLVAPAYKNMLDYIVIPPDVQAKVIQYVIKTLGVSVNRGEDNVNDEINKID
jgi:hypothetical protein